MATTTPGVALPPLFDLLAPPAPSALGDKGGAAFDALLQPPPARAAAEAIRQSPDRKQTPPGKEFPHSPQTAAAIDAPADEELHQKPERDSGVVSPPATPKMENAAEPPHDELVANPGEELVAESLAGMTACVLLVPADVQPADVQLESGEQTDAIEPALTSPKRGKQSGSQAVERAEPLIAVATKVERADQQAAVAAEVRGETAGEATPAQESAEPIVIAEEKKAVVTVASTAIREDAPRPAAALAEQAGSRQTGTENGETIELAFGERVETVEPAGQAESKSFNDEPENAAAAELQPADATTAVEIAPTSPNVTPAVPVAVAQATAAAEVSSSAKSSAASSASNTQGPARPSRLPAELLAPDAGRAARGSGANIDAPRLLNRVARAFAAAQQRDGEIQLRLSPPELGSLKLTVQMQEGVLVARLETETTSAKTALLDNLPALRERLAEQGVRIERFDVDLMQRQPGGTSDRPGEQERNAPPAPRTEPTARPRTESPSPLRATTTVGSSLTGLNVIV